MTRSRVKNDFSIGIDDSADATAITIDSSENVVIGNTSLSAAGLGVASGKNITFSEGSSVSYANIYRQNNSGGLMLANGYQYGSGTNGDHSSVGSSFAKTLIGLRNGMIQFYVDAAATASVGTQVTPTEIARMTTNGLRMANGKGIDFGATSDGSGSETSELLDDYEEGTWTPVASSNGSNISAIANVSGNYTKVGNLVNVSFYADITPTSSSTQIRVGGLPYAVADKISGTSFEGTGVVFEDSSFYFFAAFGGSSDLWIEFDRPLQGSSTTGNRSYRGSVTYFA
jgi:hypothetical protein